MVNGGTVGGFVTGGAEECVPSSLLWGVAIIALLLLLNAMGQITLKKDGFSGWNYQGAGMVRGSSTQSAVEGFGGFDPDAVGGLAGSDSPATGKDFNKLLQTASGDVEEAGPDDVVEVDALYQKGGYGDYRSGEFASAARNPVQAEDAKKLMDTKKGKALKDLWARLGGENSCGLPVDSSALAQGMSLVAINGDAPTGVAVDAWGE